MRTSLIYGGAEPGPQERLARENRRFFVDELRSPVQVGDLAEAILELLALDVPGPLHLGGADDVSRFDFAVLLGADPAQLERAADDARPRAERHARQLARPGSCSRRRSAASAKCSPDQLRPDVLERPEPQLLEVVEPRLVGAPEVLVLVLGEERVVRLDRLPAVDHEVPVGLLDVAQELGADVAAALAEELRPLAFGAVGALERLRVAHLVAEDERDHRLTAGRRARGAPGRSSRCRRWPSPPRR